MKTKNKRAAFDTLGIATVSTAHLSREDSIALQHLSKTNPLVIDYTFGFVIRVNLADPDLSSLDSLQRIIKTLNLPESNLPVSRSFIILDCDATRIEKLPTYNW